MMPRVFIFLVGAAGFWLASALPARALPPDHPRYAEIANLADRKDEAAVLRLLEVIATPWPDDPLDGIQGYKSLLPAFKALRPNGDAASEILCSEAFLQGRRIASVEAELYALLMVYSRTLSMLQKALEEAENRGVKDSRWWNLRTIKFYADHPRLQQKRLIAERPPDHPQYAEIADLAACKDQASIERLLQIIATPWPDDPISSPMRAGVKESLPAFKGLRPNGKVASEILCSETFLKGHRIIPVQAELYALLMTVSDAVPTLDKVLEETEKQGVKDDRWMNLRMIKFYFDHPRLRQTYSLAWEGVVPDFGKEERAATPQAPRAKEAAQERQPTPHPNAGPQPGDTLDRSKR